MINFTGEICAIENFEDGRFSHADFALGSSWSREYETEKAAWFVSDFCVSCTLYIATLLTMEKSDVHHDFFFF